MTDTNHQNYLDTIADALEEYYSEAYDEAASLCQKAQKINPKGSEGIYLLGLIAYDLGNTGKACSLIEKAHEIDGDVREYVDILAQLFTQTGRLADGLYYAKLSVALEPHAHIRNLIPPKLNNYFRALVNVTPQEHLFNATIAFQAGDIQAAIKHCLLELDINPNSTDALRLLASSYISAKRYQDALIPIKSAQNLAPGNADDDLLIGQAMLGMGQREVASDSFQRAMDMQPENVKYHNAYIHCLTYQDDKNWKAYPDLHREFIDDNGLNETIIERGKEIIDGIVAARDHVEKTYGPKKFIRIGLLSNLFYDCEQARWIEGFLRNCDHKQFEIYAYHDATIRDEMTTRLEGHMDSWRPFNEIDDLTAATIVANDDIDVLINLSGYSQKPRFELLKLHPARKQISWLGLPEIGGIDGIDYVLSDDISIESDKKYTRSEGCISLGKSIIAIDPMTYMPDVKPAPCLRDKHINFGGILIPSRLDTKTLSLWANVLDAIPTSILRLGNPVNSHPDTLSYCDLFFKSRGLSNRVIIENLPGIDDTVASNEDLLSDVPFFNDIDILLDSTTVSGSQQTILSLWMGVPVITLTGNRRVSLISSSILSAANHTQWIAASPDEFVDIAKTLAADLNEINVIRQALRDDISHTQLFSPKTFSMALQKALAAISGVKNNS